VNGVSDSVDKSLVSVGRKVNDYARTRSDGTGNVDVEHDLAVSAAGVCGVVPSGSYWEGYYGRWLLTEGFEVGRNVCLAKAAAKFDDADCLIGCCNAIWKLVEFADLDRSIRDYASGMGTGETLALSGLSSGYILFAKDAKVWFSLRTIVQA
jgi:hypothetical protein